MFWSRSRVDFIKIAENAKETTKSKEVPLDRDGKLLLSTVQRYFSENVIGIEYYNTDTKTYRVIDLDENENKFRPPKSGWSNEIKYVCVYKKNKKSTENVPYSENKKEPIKNQLCNLIMWRLPKQIKENDLKIYLEKFGEIEKISIKRGFCHVVIRFTTLNNKSNFLSNKSHVISGKNIDNICLLKNMNEIRNFQPIKLYVKMQSKNLMVSELHEYFTKIATKYKFVYVYKPTIESNYAFVTYMDGEIAQKLCTEKLPEYKETNIVVELAKPNNRNEFRKKEGINKEVEKIRQNLTENQVSSTSPTSQENAENIVLINQSQKVDNINNNDQRNEEINNINNDVSRNNEGTARINHERNDNQPNYRSYYRSPNENQWYQENGENYRPPFEYYGSQNENYRPPFENYGPRFGNYGNNRPRTENYGNQGSGNEEPATFAAQIGIRVLTSFIRNWFS